MKIIRKFEIWVTIDTEKANINTDKWGDKYDRNAYPNWEINYAGEENRFVQSCLHEFRKNFRFTGLRCRIREI